MERKLPLDASGWLRETAQLELFEEAMPGWGMPGWDCFFGFEINMYISPADAIAVVG